MARQGIGHFEPGNAAGIPDMELRGKGGGIVKRGNREVDRGGLVIDLHGERRSARGAKTALAKVGGPADGAFARDDAKVPDRNRGEGHDGRAARQLA